MLRVRVPSASSYKKHDCFAGVFFIDSVDYVLLCNTFVAWDSSVLFIALAMKSTKSATLVISTKSCLQAPIFLALFLLTHQALASHIPLIGMISPAKMTGGIVYLHSAQFTPMESSATIGTSRDIADSITSTRRSRTASASCLGASTTSSS